VDSHDERSGVYKIKQLIVDPFMLDVVDDKSTIERYKGRLDRGEIDADDLCVWVFLCELYCPCPCSTTQVEDVLDIVGEGADIEGTVEGYAPCMVLDVESINLDLVIRKIISCLYFVSAPLL